MSYQSSDFSRLSSQIEANIELIAKNVRLMQKTPVNQPQLFKTQHTTNLLARDTNSLIKDLAQLPHPANPLERRQRNFIRDKLTGDFSDALKNFQVLQRAIKGSGDQVLIDINQPQQNDGQEQEPQQQQQFQLQEQSNVDLEQLREREDSVRNLEHDIVEVNTIFKDLANLIHEQGEAVDSIESSIYRATEDLSRGAQEIAKARQYQDRSRRKKLYLVMIFLVIMIILLLIVFKS